MKSNPPFVNYRWPQTSSQAGELNWAITISVHIAQVDLVH